MDNELNNINMLLDYLSSNDTQQRELAAVELGRLGDQRALNGLLQSLKDEDSCVCYAATYAVGKLQSEEAIPNLILMLSDDEASVRASAVWALGYFIKYSKAVTAIKQAFNDTDEDVRWTASEVLELHKLNSK